MAEFKNSETPKNYVEREQRKLFEDIPTDMSAGRPLDRALACEELRNGGIRSGIFSAIPAALGANAHSTNLILDDLKINTSNCGLTPTPLEESVMTATEALSMSRGWSNFVEKADSVTGTIAKYSPTMAAARMLMGAKPIPADGPRSSDYDPVD